MSEPADRLSRAEALLGHAFADRALLEAALTHPSALPEVGATVSYERLEFLGDSVLGFIVADHLFRHLPGAPEGELTRRKVAVVNGVLLSAVARDLGLDELIVYGKGERESARGRATSLENALEALIGAMFLDAGLDAANGVVTRLFGPLLDRADLVAPQDPKSVLQQLTQAEALGHPRYEVIERAGPVHDPTFTVAVRVAGEVVGTGRGCSKQAAEKAAAAAALEAMEHAEHA